ncbi:hypothetical protein NHQ30_008612 [Ciborinia camelliae]|nr:hypothetical protein NHQ30_008612 [Ciborinia camelliae]
MLRTVPIYPGPLRMSAEEHYEHVESRATVTKEGNRIICRDNITVNVDFGTVNEARHSEDCVCVVCRNVERIKMGKSTVITGGNGEFVGDEDEGCGEGESHWGGGNREDEDDCDNEKRGGEHDGEVIFAGSGRMTQFKISKPFTPKLRKGKEAGASTLTIRTDGWGSRSSLPGHEVQRDRGESRSLEVSRSNTSGIQIALAPSPPPDSGVSLRNEREQSSSKDLHATWDPRTKNKEGLTSKGLGAMKRSLSRRSLTMGKEKKKENVGSGNSRTSKVWAFARSLSRRSDNKGHSSQMRKGPKEGHADFEERMDESGEIEGQHSSFEEGESSHTSFQGDDVVEHGEWGMPEAFIGPRRNPEIDDFPNFDPEQFVPPTPAEWQNTKRRSGSESNISMLSLEERSRSRSPSLGSRHYSSRGSFSLNWDNISSDTVYHKHARRFYQNPSAYGEEIPGYNPETDNPYLEYDRFQEVSEWADSTEEADPDHVVALTTRELKRLYGDEVKVPFDFIPEGYANPPNSKTGSVIGDDEDAYLTITGQEWDEEKEPEFKHKDLVSLLGMPGWRHDWEDMTKMQRHFHIVAPGDWRMGQVFDVKSNYSDYYGVPLFEPHDVGLCGVDRKDMRGLDIPGLEELELKFRMAGCDNADAGGHEERDPGGQADDNVGHESAVEYDSDGFLYDDDKRGQITGSVWPAGFTASEARRIYQRPSDEGEGSENTKSVEGSEAGEYEGSMVEGYGTTDNHLIGTNTNGYGDDSFRVRMAQGYTVPGRLFEQSMMDPANLGSLDSEEEYDTDDDEEYESDDGASNEYSFGDSSYHDTDCQEDYVIGTSIFAPHAFQLYPPYDSANDCTTVGLTPDEVESARPPAWDAEYMEDILRYSVNEEHKARDPTAEMVLMSYLDPVSTEDGPSQSGSKSRSRSSTGSTTPVPSPTKSLVPTFKSFPPTPSIGGRSTISFRKPSLSTANVAKLEGKAKDKGKGKYQASKSSKGKGKAKGKGKSKIAPPSHHSSDSDSNTSYVDLTRSGSSYAVPPAQSLILYLHGCGLSTSYIAFLLQPLDHQFLYDSSSSWWPPTSSTPIPSSTDTDAPSKSPKRFPPHHLFTPSTVSQILSHCAGPKQWWEEPHAIDPYGKLLPASFKTLQRGMQMRKAKVLVRKCVENFYFWRLRGAVPHSNLMRG